jgi:deazaflavin-dependent oxidoreductase (nitroreductase family)
MLVAMTDFNDPNRQLIEEFRVHKGELSGRFEGSPILLLTTAGARSGIHHTTPMMYRRDGERLLVFASNAGARKVPDWFHNLVAHPDVTVEIGPDTYEATAVVTEGDERERLFAETLIDYPFFAEHQHAAGRQIPVVALERI